MIVDSTTFYPAPAFKKFIKVHGKTKQLRNFRERLREESPDFISILAKKYKQDSCLYLISGKTSDIFIELMQKISYFRELRTNIEKYMPRKPKTISVKDAFNQLEKGKFKI